MEGVNWIILVLDKGKWLAVWKAIMELVSIQTVGKA
jgi:hypothetical protein